MALTRCLDCRATVSTAAAACPKCGAPVTPRNVEVQQRERKTILWVIAAAVVLVLIAKACNSGSSTASSATETSSQKASVQAPEAASSNTEEKSAGGAAPATAATVEQPSSNWHYEVSSDDMSSKPVYTATVTSDTHLNLGFPYEGDQTAQLTLRRHPRYGSDAIVAIEKGQILCSTYSCPIRVRFDDGKAMTLTGTEPSDNSSTYVFLPYATMSKRLAGAKKLKVEFDAFHQGTQLVEFNVQGFDPAQLK